MPITKKEYGRLYKEGGLTTTIRVLVSKGVPPALAEECAQDAWTKGLIKLSQLKDSNLLVAWITSIARNKWLLTLRKMKRIPTEKLNDHNLSEIRTMTALNHAVQLKQIMRGIHKSQRRLFELEFKGYSTEEVAMIEKTTPAAIRTRRSRAKNRILANIKKL